MRLSIKKIAVKILIDLLDKTVTWIYVSRFLLRIRQIRILANKPFIKIFGTDSLHRVFDFKRNCIYCILWKKFKMKLYHMKTILLTDKLEQFIWGHSKVTCDFYNNKNGLTQFYNQFIQMYPICTDRLS